MNCARLESAHPRLAGLCLARRRSGELGRQHRRPRQVGGLRLQRLQLGAEDLRLVPLRFDLRPQRRVGERLLVGGGLRARQPRLVPVGATGARAALRRRGCAVCPLALQRLQLGACLLDRLVGGDTPARLAPKLRVQRTQLKPQPCHSGPRVAVVRILQPLLRPERRLECVALPLELVHLHPLRTHQRTHLVAVCEGVLLRARELELGDARSAGRAGRQGGGTGSTGGGGSQRGGGGGGVRG